MVVAVSGSKSKWALLHRTGHRSAIILGSHRGQLALIRRLRQRSQAPLGLPVYTIVGSLQWFQSF